MSNQAISDESDTTGLIDAWKCPACGHVNEIRDSCLKCGRRRKKGSVRAILERDHRNELEAVIGWAIIFLGMFRLRILLELSRGTDRLEVTLLILGFGVVFTNTGTYRLWRAYGRRNWLATFCEVTRVSTIDNRGWSIYYRYNVSGEAFIGSWICNVSFWDTIPEDPEVVFYNPRNPKQSVVDRKAGVSMAVANMIIGFVLLAIGPVTWMN